MRTKIVRLMSSMSTWLPVSMICALQTAQVAQAQSVIGTVTNVSGNVTARRFDGSTQPLAERAQVHEGDTLVTDRESFAKVTFVDDGVLVLKPQSRVLVRRYVFEVEQPARDTVTFELQAGGLRSSPGMLGKRSPDATTIRTPSGVVKARDADFVASLLASPEAP
jgi:hypothetical protein